MPHHVSRFDAFTAVSDSWSRSPSHGSASMSPLLVRQKSMQQTALFKYVQAEISRILQSLRTESWFYHRGPLSSGEPQCIARSRSSATRNSRRSRSRGRSAQATLCLECTSPCIFSAVSSNINGNHNRSFSEALSSLSRTPIWVDKILIAMWLTDSRITLLNFLQTISSYIFPFDFVR